jgi:hypothetical protein
MVLLVSALVAWLLLKAEREAWILWQYLSWFVLMFFYLWAASNACRFLVDARRSGLIELILATPVTDRDFVRGHWRGIIRQFALPLGILVALVAGASWLGQSAWQKTIGSLPTAPPPTATVSTNSITSTTTVVYSFSVKGRSVSNYNAGAIAKTPSVAGRDYILRHAIPIAGAVFGAGTAAANFLAILCFGMWMGMTSRSVNTATAKTILFVYVIPWLCILFISAIAVTTTLTALSARKGASFPPRYFMYYPLVSLAVSSVLTIAKDVGFFVWARGQLRRNFRDQAVRGITEQRIPPVPSAMAPTITAPPVIPAPPVLSA